MTSHILNTINKFKYETKKKRTDRNGYLVPSNLKSIQTQNSNVLDNNKEDKVENDKKISKGLKRLLITNICLIFAVIIYSSLGALMFQLLEQHEELRRCEGIYLIDFFTILRRPFALVRELLFRTFLT